jgi:hypothetical protein
MRSIHLTVTASTATALAALACGSDTTAPYEPNLPVAWASAITNPYLPLEPGAVWEYVGETEEGTETITVEVLAQTRLVNGVTAAVVHDRVLLDGELIENTYDWYAQDADGNVWYLGEDTEELENGVVVSTAGSWEWNVDGALPGIYMWADPSAHVGEEYRQELYRGEAEDWGKVVALGQTVAVPFGTLSECVVTEDWNALEGRSATLENKYYCPGVGTALEVGVSDPTTRVELTEHTP